MPYCSPSLWEGLGEGNRIKLKTEMSARITVEVQGYSTQPVLPVDIDV